ncbi:hypothetical protein BpHYR1_025910 [Brachionus plicatilis]|uniref:Uncharacterized protein n=1 Tax=Brachionus plicatilis TaxID=10195 RepID=A0A3M7QW41_BRAPC|nr:hypothetical protein BpHYR1_025910 [Brachionus plicatilis]
METMSSNSEFVSLLPSSLLSIKYPLAEFNPSFFLFINPVSINLKYKTLNLSLFYLSPFEDKAQKKNSCIYFEIHNAGTKQ